MIIGKLIKQPNEKYCVVNYSGEVVRYNLTEQDIVKMYIDDAKAHIGTAERFENIIVKTDNIPDDIVEEMGFDKPYKELKKFVPCKPTNQSYGDFATHGRCPSCGEFVRDGMGHTDKQCKCGQMLKWR